MLSQLIIPHLSSDISTILKIFLQSLNRFCLILQIIIFYYHIKNVPFYTKPEGGFWDSKANEHFGWKDWCKTWQYHTEKLEEYFQFTVAPEANTIEIHSCEDLKLIPQASLLTAMYIPDFESLALNGVDAIEVFISKDIELYDKLLGWDVDSILIMNPEIIVLF